MCPPGHFSDPSGVVPAALPLPPPTDSVRRLSCHMCGYLFSPWTFLRAGLALALQKTPRWPQRLRASAHCPECGHLQTIATWISRYELETV